MSLLPNTIRPFYSLYFALSHRWSKAKVTDFSTLGGNGDETRIYEKGICDLREIKSTSFAINISVG